MLMLVMRTSYLTSQQSRQLLNTFCPAISEKETNRAGTLLHMATLDPLDYWQDVLPVLEPSVQSDIHELVRTVGIMDLANPTNRHAAPFPQHTKCCNQYECTGTLFYVLRIL
jgi:hypothetical protein